MTQVEPPFPLAGEAAALGAALLWAVSICLFKRFGARVPARLLNLYKSCIALACLGVTFIIVRPEWPDDARASTLLVVSGIVGLALGDTAFFAALRRLGAQLTATTQCASPPIAAVIALFLWGETLQVHQTVGLVVTVAAVAGVVWFGRASSGRAAMGPPTGLAPALGLGLVLAFVSAACQALGIVLAREGFQQSDVVPGTILRFAPAVVVLALMDIPGRVTGRRSKSSATPRELVIIAVAGFLGTYLGVMLLSAASKYAKAGVATAVSSTYPVWIVPIAAFVLGERPTRAVITCTVAAVVGIAVLVIKVSA